MRALIIFAVIISYLLASPLTGICLQTSKANIEEVYQKKDTRSWGEIFSWLFNRKQFEKSYALVIGIGDYQKDWPKLEASYYDALRVRDFLVNDAGFDYVITLTNAKATKQKINNLMEETFPNLLHKNDRFLFYFSGHGTQRPIGEIPIGYLVLQNCDSESYGSMIAMEDIERWDRLIHPTQHVLFILDSCFSGLAGQQRKSPLTDKKLERLSQYSHHLITAGTADEISVAHLSKWHGSLFTDSFLTAVSGRADLRSRDFEADGVVSLKELMKYVGDRIDNESVKLRSKNPLSKGIKMSPQISDLQENAGEFFFITKHIKNKKLGNVSDKELECGWPVVETKGVSSYTPSLEAEIQRLTEELERLKKEREGLEVDRRLMEEKKRLEAELEAEHQRLEKEKQKLSHIERPAAASINKVVIGVLDFEMSGTTTRILSQEEIKKILMKELRRNTWVKLVDIRESCSLSDLKENGYEQAEKYKMNYGLDMILHINQNLWFPAVHGGISQLSESHYSFSLIDLYTKKVKEVFIDTIRGTPAEIGLRGIPNRLLVSGDLNRVLRAKEKVLGGDRSLSPR